MSIGYNESELYRYKKDDPSIFNQHKKAYEMLFDIGVHVFEKQGIHIKSTRFTSMYGSGPFTLHFYPVDSTTYSQGVDLELELQRIYHQKQLDKVIPGYYIQVDYIEKEPK